VALLPAVCLLHILCLVSVTVDELTQEVKCMCNCRKKHSQDSRVTSIRCFDVAAKILINYFLLESLLCAPLWSALLLCCSRSGFFLLICALQQFYSQQSLCFIADCRVFTSCHSIQPPVLTVVRGKPLISS